MFGIFRRKPPTRLELVKRGLAGGVETARDTLTSTVSNTLNYVPVDKLGEVGHSLADSASHAWGAVAQTAGGVAQRAAESDVVKAAADKAGAAREAAVKAAKTARGTASDAQVAALDKASDMQEQAAAQIPIWKLRAAKGAAAKAAQLEAAKVAAEQEAAVKAKAAKALAKKAAKRVPTVEVETKEDGSKWLWVIVGLVAGAFIAVLLTPATGRRSRAALQDKIKQAGQGAADAGTSAVDKVTELKDAASNKVADLTATVSDKASDLKATVTDKAADLGAAVADKATDITDIKDAAASKVAEVKDNATDKATELSKDATKRATDAGNRAAGLANQAKSAAQGAQDTADDITIADRVRTVLGEDAATRHLERINVDSINGVVTLRGPQLSEAEQQAVEKVVGAVKGVQKVHSEILTEDESEDAKPFVG